MHAIDQLIAVVAGRYREILKDEGIGGLLRASSRLQTAMSAYGDFYLA
ncbi:MAG: hypothetical protein ACLS6O_08345 [Bifidobacterium sp.]